MLGDVEALSRSPRCRGGRRAGAAPRARGPRGRLRSSQARRRSCRLLRAPARAGAWRPRLRAPPRRCDDAAEEADDPLGRLALQQIAGRAGANRREQVVLALRGGQDDHLATRAPPRGGRAAPRGRRAPASSGRAAPGRAAARVRSSIASSPSAASPTTSNPFRASSEASASRVSGWSSTIRIASSVTQGSSAGRFLPTTVNVQPERDNYQAWLWGEVLLFGLLGAALSLFLAYPSIGTSHYLPELRLVVDTGSCSPRPRRDAQRARVSRSRAGVSTFCSAAASSPPSVRCSPLRSRRAWAASRRPRRRLGRRRGAHARWRADRGRAVGPRPGAIAQADARQFARDGRDLAGNHLGDRAVTRAVVARPRRRAESRSLPLLLTFALAVQALLDLMAVVGFGLRFRKSADDFDRWLALGATLDLFGSLYLSSRRSRRRLRLAGRLPARAGVRRPARRRLAGHPLRASSAVRSPKSALVSRARSTTVSRSTSSPSRPTRHARGRRRSRDDAARS